MKLKSKLTSRALAGGIITLALGFAAASLHAQKSDPVSPNEPKVTICHKQKNTITVGQSAVPAHLAHGDTLGPCEGEANVTLCHRGVTITVASSAVAAHMSHGDTMGPCSSFAASALRSSVSTTVAAPATATPAATPTVTPPAPAKPAGLEDVSICYKGHTVLVTPTSVQTYLSIGATLGACPKQSEAKTESTDKEATEKTSEPAEAQK